MVAVIILGVLKLKGSADGGGVTVVFIAPNFEK
jgi:hypothetical protein